MKKGKILINDILFIGILLIGSYVDNMLIYLLCCIFILLNIMKTKKIKSNYLYILLLGIGIFSSLIHFNSLTIRNIVRDFYYFSVGFVFILSGYYIGYSLKNKKMLIRDLYYFIFLKVLINLLKVFGNIALGKVAINFQSIRDVCGLDTELVATSLAIIITFSNNEMLKIFNKKKIRIIILFETIALLCSFSRTGYTIFIIMLIVLNFKSIKKFQIRKINKCFCVLLIITFIICIMPKSFTQPFINKFKKSASEISSSNKWNNTTIIQNWRGYELYEAKITYKNSTILEKIFGSGFGKLIRVKNSELVGIASSEGGITILHNGYAMLLIKTGIIGTLMFLLWLFQYFYKGFVNKKNVYSRILISLIVSIIFDTYVVSGLFKAAVSFGFTVSIGIVIAMHEIKNIELKVG